MKKLRLVLMLACAVMAQEVVGWEKSSFYSESGEEVGSYFLTLGG